VIEGRDTPTIMVADDVDDERLVLKTFLEANGYRVVEARSGREAVEVASRECPDLILMDLHMPELDGLAAIEQIRARQGAWKRMPILAMTAYGAFGIREAVFEAGGDEYLVKPVDFSWLDRIIIRLLGGFEVAPLHAARPDRRPLAEADDATAINDSAPAASTAAEKR
jgi:CheY-like chemotaxis protein